MPHRHAGRNRAADHQSASGIPAIKMTAGTRGCRDRDWPAQSGQAGRRAFDDAGGKNAGRGSGTDRERIGQGDAGGEHELGGAVVHQHRPGSQRAAVAGDEGPLTERGAAGKTVVARQTDGARAEIGQTPGAGNEAGDDFRVRVIIRERPVVDNIPAAQRTGGGAVAHLHRAGVDLRRAAIIIRSEHRERAGAVFDETGDAADFAAAAESVIFRAIQGDKAGGHRTGQGHRLIGGGVIKGHAVAGIKRAAARAIEPVAAGAGIPDIRRAIALPDEAAGKRGDHQVNLIRHGVIHRQRDLGRNAGEHHVKIGGATRARARIADDRVATAGQHAHQRVYRQGDRAAQIQVARHQNFVIGAAALDRHIRKRELARGPAVQGKTVRKMQGSNADTRADRCSVRARDRPRHHAVAAKILAAVQHKSARHLRSIQRRAVADYQTAAGHRTSRAEHKRAAEIGGAAGVSIRAVQIPGSAIDLHRALAEAVGDGAINIPGAGSL